MKQYLNNTSDVDPKQIAEINRISCITGNGYDNIKFIDPHSQIAGDLGISYRKEYINAPTYASEGTGELDETKYYSIRLVPVSTLIVDPNSGSYLQGPANHWADPVQPSVASASIVFDLPADEPTDTLSFHAGTLTEVLTSTVTDTEQEFTESALVDYFLLNVETGEMSVITANDATTITTDDDLVFEVGDRYQVVQMRITDYYVYACELESAALVVGGVWVLQAVVSVDAGTYELDSYLSSGTPLLDIYYPPEAQRSCTEADGMLFLGGGVYDNTGEAVVDTYEETFQASSTSTIKFASSFETALVWGESVVSKIMRVTLPSSDSISKCQIGSVLNISSSEDSDNDVEDLLITNVASDGSWFEFVNNNGVDNTDDETVLVTMYRNVLVGNTTGDGATNFSEGMTNARFQFKSDAQSFGIRWVDEITQTIGLTEPYTGLSKLEVVDDNEPQYAIDLVRDATNSNAGHCMFADQILDLTSTADFTISFWFMRKGDNTTTPYFLFLGDETLGTSCGLYLNYSDADGRYVIGYNFPSLSCYFEDTLQPVDEWHKYTITVNTTGTARIRLYIDGVEVSRTFNNGTPTAWTLAQADTAIKLGHGGVDAEVANVSIYDSTLSDDDVASEYLGKTISGLIAEWVGDEGSGDFYSETLGGPDMYHSVSSYTTTPTATTPSVWNNYTQTVVIENDDEIEINRDYGISWSDQDQPHIFRTENYTPISDNVYGLETYNGMLLVFCENSIYMVSLQGLGQTPSLISEHVSCIATSGKVSTPVGVFFYDGSGISMTDGLQVVPVTSYRAQSFMDSINKNMAYNIRAVYDPDHRRVEFSFPFGSETENNYGLVISIDSMNCYPTYRQNCNALWLQKNEYGDRRINHGTTARIGSGRVLEHDDDIGTDGNFTTELSGVISSITDNTMTIDFGTPLNGDSEEDDPTLVAGDILCVIPHSGAKYRQAQIVSVTLSETQTDDSNYYEVELDDLVDISDLSAGDTAVAGGIPFDFGVKWTDFASPQYKKNVRQLQLDATNFNGILYVEHYKDIHNLGPFRATVHYVNADTTKIISKVKSGDLYHYGFRIYGVSLTKHSFHSFEILYDLEQ